MLKISKFMLAAAFTASLAACGGGGSGSGGFSPLTSTTNIAAPVVASTTAAVVNTPFAFPSGVPSLGTTSATTVAFTSTGDTPAFSIGSGGAVATGATRFGSCIFTVTASTFPPGFPLSTGQVVTVQPCSLNVVTAGGLANGSSALRNVSLVLGTTLSTSTPLSVIIAPDGKVTINNIVVGTATVAPVSGS